MPFRTYHSISFQACKGLSQTCHWSSKHNKLRMRPFVLRCSSMLQHRTCCLPSFPSGRQRIKELLAEVEGHHEVCAQIPVL